MEGPSLVIATEEFAPYRGRAVTGVTGSQAEQFRDLKKQKLRAAASWGKHFLLVFPEYSLRIHFLMFGSYRINDPREGREPKLALRFGSDELHFYSCAIKRVEGDARKNYDWSNDLMSEKWDAAKALAKLRKKPEAVVSDVLMDQEIFSGLGNIIKNEVLFRLRLHPEVKVGALTAGQLRALVKEARDYSHQFYEWKKKNVLKRNWKIFRKRKCPECEGPVTKRPTGKLARLSHFCPRCQINAAGIRSARSRANPRPSASRPAAA